MGETSQVITFNGTRAPIFDQVNTCGSSKRLRQRIFGQETISAQFVIVPSYCFLSRTVLLFNTICSANELQSCGVVAVTLVYEIGLLLSMLEVRPIMPKD